MKYTRLLTIAIAGTALVGCGADSADSADSAAADSAAAAADSSDADATNAAGESTVTIRATDYSFLDVPTAVTAGTTFALSNESEVEAHELVAVRLPDDEERPVAELVALPPEEFGPLMVGLETVVIAGPEDDGTAVVGDGSLSEPGRYALICVIPTGADPEEYLTKAATSDGPPDVAGGPPHTANGMFAELTVTE